MPSAVLRRAQTLQEIDRLAIELETWRKRREDADSERKQYQTQLAAIGDEVAGALGAVRQQTSKLGLAGTATGDLFDQLARIDRQIVWTRYAWDFFRSRFDQRDDPVLQAVLKAADEVSWSCFKPLFEGKAATRPPAPLVCIELDYTPSTLLSRHAHAMQHLVGDDVGPLKDFFEGLPVPLLRLPPAVVTSPWLLAVIAHEAGHALFEHVERDGTFPERFADLVEQAARKAGADEGEQARWRTWSNEIFADLYAVMMIGPAAVWTLAHFDRGRDDLMGRQRPSYPPARVRLLLLGRMAEKLGLVGHWSLFSKLDISADELKAQSGTLEGRIADEVAKLAAVKLVTRKGALADAVLYRTSDFEAADGRGPRKSPPVEQWRDALLGKLDKANESDLRTARLVAAGGVAAALELEAECIKDENKIAAERNAEGTPSDKLNAALGKLRESSLQRIVACAEKGTRAAAPQAPRVEHRSLASRLLEASDDDLFSVDAGAPESRP